MDQVQKLYFMIDGENSVFAINTTDTLVVVDLFRKLSRNTGKAIYLWVPDEGLHRLNAGHIVIPNTLRPADCLDYIIASKHYGVYILPEVQGHLETAVNRQRLKRIANLDLQPRRIAILIGQVDEIPQELEQVIVRVNHTKRPSPRLRQGRWIVEEA
jgi:hypothetical protein